MSRHGYVYLELSNVSGGLYNIRPCTFYPHQEAPFFLNISCTCPVTISAVSWPQLTTHLIYGLFAPCHFDPWTFCPKTFRPLVLGACFAPYASTETWNTPRGWTDEGAKLPVTTHSLNLAPTVALPYRRSLFALVVLWSVICKYTFAHRCKTAETKNLKKKV